MKVKIELETMKDVNDFVKITEKIDEKIYLSDGNLRVSAKSLLGALYTLEWNEIWCECEKDIYRDIERFVA